MSEYQVYEFLAIDRPLSAADIAYVRTLSSRVEPTPTHAVFTYSFGDFRGDPLKLLARCYDAMFYIANWGTKQLAFRFPKAALDQAALQPYYYGVEEIELTTTSEYAILDITFDDEEGYGWIEGEGILTEIAPLRDDIMRGDLRALYLAWLASAARGASVFGKDEDEDNWDDNEEGDEDANGEMIEPPVPPGLGQLTGPLQTFIELFDVDPDLVGAAAQASLPLKATAEPVERWVSLLPNAERDAFLVRAARGESVGLELLRRLREVGEEPRLATSTASQRTFNEIVAGAADVRRERLRRERQEAERARLAKLDALAVHEEMVWAHLPELLARRTAHSYDAAVAHLVDLRDLAVHRKQRAAFDARLQNVLAPYAASAALQRRLRENKLLK